MTTQATQEQAEPLQSTHDFALIDCDVHPSFYDGVNDLVPYLPQAWKHRLGLISFASASTYPGSQFMVPKNVMYLNVAGTLREDAVGPDGSFPAADPVFTAQHLLDQYKIDRAILSTNQIAGLGDARDARPRGDPGVGVQRLAERALARGRRALPRIDPGRPSEPGRGGAGDRSCRGTARDRPGTSPALEHPDGRASVRPDLRGGPSGTAFRSSSTPNSTDGIYLRSPALAGGPPTFYIEWHTLLSQVFAANLVSVLCQPVFQKFPTLKLVIAEGGFAWLADVLWRLDRNWKSMRDEVPWVERQPSEYVFERVRFTTQPFVEPERPEHLAAMCDIMHAEQTLLFSSDYPHWDFDNPVRALEDLPEGIRQRVFVDNALELYGERLI